ncbi:MAG: hypothetical protein ACRD0U_16025 [Acidimicrobiales bacterium]
MSIVTQLGQSPSCSAFSHLSQRGIEARQRKFLILGRLFWDERPPSDLHDVLCVFGSRDGLAYFSVGRIGGG